MSEEIKEQNAELIKKSVENFAEYTRIKKINDANSLILYLYEKSVRPLLDYTIDEIDYAFKQIEAKKITAIRKKRYLISFRNAIDYALREDIINRRTDRVSFWEFVFSNKFVRLTESGISRDFIQITPDEIKQFLEEIRKTNIREYILFSILCYSGCRISGLVNLLVKNIDFEKGIFKTQEKVTKSSSGYNRYFLPMKFMDELQVYIARNSLKIEDKISSIGDKQIRKNLKQYRKEWWPHLFRHTLRVNWHLIGMQKPDADMLLNHQPDSVDSVYLKTLNNYNYLRKTYDKYFPY